MRRSIPSAKTIFTAVLVASVSVAGLAGCWPRSNAPAPTPSGSMSPSNPGGGGGGGGNGGGGGGGYTASQASCDSIISPQDLYDYNPNLVFEAGYQPEAGSLEATLAGIGGTACAWINETSGSLIQLGVAHPDKQSLDGLKANAKGQRFDIAGREIFFTENQGVGEVQVFTPTSMMVATSDMFFSEGDAAPLIAAARNVLTVG